MGGDHLVNAGAVLEGDLAASAHVTRWSFPGR
jgi:hypothetical protein